MRKRIIMLIICLLSLILGVVIYTYFRSDTYIGKLVNTILSIQNTPCHSFATLSYYLPDYLWAFSLCSGLFAVYPLKPHRGFCWGLLTLIYGVIWETLQYFSFVSGTFDFIDIIMYFTAVCTVVIINYIINKENKNEKH